MVGLTDAFKLMPEKRGLYVPNAAASTVRPMPPMPVALAGAR